MNAKDEAADLLLRMLPFRIWVATVPQETAALSIQAFGSLENAYLFVFGGLAEVALLPC